MINFKKINDEIYYSQDAITKIASADISLLKEKVVLNPRNRIRICAHPNTEDELHEMLIVLQKGVDVPPHKHENKSESFHIIEGRLKVLFFNESGEIIDSVEMGDVASGKPFFYRLSKPIFHTVIPISDFVVFHEVTNGPFIANDMIIAPWIDQNQE